MIIRGLSFVFLSAFLTVVAYPLLVILTFLFVTLGAIFIFGEVMTLPKLVGILIILIGITIVSRGKLL